MIEQFRKLYGDSYPVRVYRAPGRVNLIGEHTDYNLGFVLPIALHLACYVAAAPSTDGRIHVYSLDRGEGFDFDPDVQYAKPRHDWTDYVIGVAHQFAINNARIRPANLLIHSEVPEGSGLSSSAALEVASALAFLGGRSYGKVEMAKLCQKAETDFVGMPCGIMDQYVSVFGRQGGAIEIDCRSLEYRIAALPEDTAIVAVNSMVKHELASSAYKVRVQECAAAVEAIRKKHPKLESLRDATLDQLNEAPVNGTILKRARHILTENRRVGAFLEASKRGDLAEMGKLFVASHRSMQHDYEISCEEIDYLVDTAVGQSGVYGARMTGGGFGGCTVNLVAKGKVDDFRENIVRKYKDKYNVEPRVIRCIPSAGAGEIKDFEKLPPAPPLKS